MAAIRCAVALMRELFSFARKHLESFPQACSRCARTMQRHPQHLRARRETAAQFPAFASRRWKD
jgi:hypothetical protein